MSNYFKTHGRTLIANGYLVIPISAGHKFPALKGWETSRFTAMQLDDYPNCGVGILCGQGAVPLAAIDIDTTNEILAQQMTQWCFEHLGVTCERIGKSPKILLPYRAHEAGWKKATGKWFVDKAGTKHRLEVLGHGQQFVAYHIHPDTRKPYVWTDIFGGFEAMKADDLPVIELDQVQEVLAEFERLAQINGLTLKTGGTTLDGKRSTMAAPAEPLAATEPPVGLPMTRAKVLLEHVDAADYDTWLKVGMSLHHEYAGGDAALALWDEWSSKAANYVGEEDLLKRWDGFGAKGHRPVTIRWLMKHGRETRKVAENQVKRSALEEARDAIVQCNDTIELLGDIARQAGEAAGSDLAIRAELEGLIRVRFKALTLSKTSLPLTTVRIAMGGARREEPAPSTVVEDDGAGINNKRRERTEFGNAERMLDQHADSLLYSPQLDRWFMWTGVYWRHCAGVEIGHMAKQTIRALPSELEFISGQVEREAFYKFAAASQKASMVAAMISLAQSDPRVLITAEQLDYRRELLGVRNGAIDLTTGELLPPDPLHRITMTCAVSYDPKAEAPLWRRTVAEVFFGDCEMIDFFQRLIGHALLGDPKEDILVIPHGMGSNGKSTVLGAIRQVLGDYAKGCSSETFLTAGNGHGHSAGAPREDLLRLRGARFVYVSEPEENSELKESLIKKVTGGDVVEARGIHAKSTIEFTPTWVPFIPTNHRPIVKGEDLGIWRRLLLVPFTRNFETDKEAVKDEDRAHKLMTEWPGILRWCVEGALAYQEMGLKPPGGIRTARDEYRQDMDLLAEWVGACLETKTGACVPINTAFSSWELFAKGRGEFQYVRTARALMRRLQHRFDVGYEGSQRVVHGVQLRPQGLDQ